MNWWSFATLVPYVLPAQGWRNDVFHKNYIGPIIWTDGTIFLLLLYSKSSRAYLRLKYMYSVMSVKMKRLQDNTKNRLFLRSWLIMVRFVHPDSLKSLTHRCAPGGTPGCAPGCEKETKFLLGLEPAIGEACLQFHTLVRTRGHQD